MPGEKASGRTLEGRLVVVTRPEDRAGGLVRLLEERGARAVLAPAIEVAPASSDALDAAVRELVGGGFDWVLFTSRAGVEAVADRLRVGGHDRGSIRARIAAVGSGTARELRAFGLEPDLVPETFTTYALGRALPRGRGRVLLARADIALSELESMVAAKGWTPVRVDAYRNRPAGRLPAPAARALREGSADAVTFTSASTVQGFLGLAGTDAMTGEGRARVVCIGPVTARAATDAGLTVDGVARPHTIEGLVAAVERVLRPRVAGKERG